MDELGERDVLERDAQRFEHERAARLCNRKLLPRPRNLCGRDAKACYLGALLEEGAGIVRLYMFEHCSLCFRVRMTAALKRLRLQETVVLDDDTETMVGLVGKRQIPILVKDDGKPMLESMDMVLHIDARGKSILIGPERKEVAAWADRF